MTPPPPAPIPPAAPSGSSKKTLWIILGSVAGGVLLLCCLIAAIIGTPPKPKDGSDLAQPTSTGANVPAGATTPSQTTSAPQPSDTLPPGSITEEGMLLVGADIKAGTYAGFGPCYWERLKNADGDFDSILANDNADTDDRVTITIRSSDYALKHECGTLIPLAALRTVPASTKTTDLHGVLVVGKDIHPGTWRGTAQGSCYWARLSGFTGDFGVILANDNVNSGSKFTINVKATDKGLQLDSDCGPLTKA